MNKLQKGRGGEPFCLKILASIFFLSLTIFVPVKDSEALSQWSRKYKVECSTCHEAFPRLNFFGEKFMRNGYQWPGESADGDKVGKEEISEDLVIDDVSNWLGARVGLTPLKFRTNNLSRNGGSTEDTLNVGEASFIQFFVAGSIFEDVSFFSEIEFTTTGTAVAFGQVHMNFTNIWGTYANLQVGRVTPVEFTSFSDTKRTFKSSNILSIQSSNNVGDNSSRVRGARPGISYYGYEGPVVWFAGVDNGTDTTDTDNNKNYWVGARLDLPASMKTAFTGSSVSYHYYEGTDTSATATAQVEDDFVRHTVGVNLRHKSNSELQFVYQHGRDDNFTFAATPLAGC